MGNENRESNPSKVSIIDTTVESTGRSINRFSIVDFFYEPDCIATIKVLLRRSLVRSVILFQKITRKDAKSDKKIL